MNIRENNEIVRRYAKSLLESTLVGNARRGNCPANANEAYASTTHVNDSSELNIKCGSLGVNHIDPNSFGGIAKNKDIKVIVGEDFIEVKTNPKGKFAGNAGELVKIIFDNLDENSGLDFTSNNWLTELINKL